VYNFFEEYEGRVQGLVWLWCRQRCVGVAVAVTGLIFSSSRCDLALTRVSASASNSSGLSIDLIRNGESITPHTALIKEKMWNNGIVII
jgi:hypothetical protein